MGRGLAQVVLLLAWVSCVTGIKNEQGQCVQDQTPGDDLVGSGAFHTCMANGTGGTQQQKTTSRRISCIGWQEFGQGVAPNIQGVKKIVGGARHSCAVDHLGLLTCWGSNAYGQTDTARPYLASPAGSPSLNPIYCEDGDYHNGDPEDVRYKRCIDIDKRGATSQLTVFEDPECALPKGQNMTFVGFTRSSFIIGKMGRDKPKWREDGKFNCNVHQVSAGGQHTCVIYGREKCTNCNFGYLRCYGSNVFGQSQVPVCEQDPGLDETFPEEVYGPKDVDDGSSTSTAYCQNGKVQATYTAVAAGLLHTCAIHRDGYLMCWGDNSWNQSTPPAGMFTQVTAGAYHSCAIDVDGKVHCWGNNTYGENRQHADLIRDNVIPEGGTFLKVSAGASHTCGLFLQSGMTLLAYSGDQDVGAVVKCWGANYAEQSSPPADKNRWMLSVSVGWEHACGVTLDDMKVICWGAKNWKTQKLQGGTPIIARSNDVERAASDISYCTSACQACITSKASIFKPLIAAPLLLASAVFALASR